MPATVSVDVDKPIPAKPAPRAAQDAPHARARPVAARGARHRGDRGRGLRDRVAGRLRSRAALRPSRAPASVRSAPGWAGRCFRSLGYAGFLLPLLLARLGRARRSRGRACARGWVPLAGLAVLVLAAAGLLQQTADTFVAQRVTRGGILATGGWVGWALTSGLHDHARPGRHLAAAAGRGAGRRAAASPRRRTRPSCRLAHGARWRRLRRSSAWPGPRRRAWSPSSRRRRSRPSRTPRSRRAAARRRAERAARPADGAGAGLAGDVRLRQGRRAVVPAAAGGPAEGAAGRGAAAHARGAAGQRRDPAPQAAGLRGRRPHRAGEPGPDHHLVRVRAGGRREGQPGREPLRRPGAGAQGGLRAHRGTDSRARHGGDRGAERRSGDRVPARDLRLARSSPSPRASCRWPSARTCTGQPVVADLTAMPHLLDRRRHRQRQVGRPQRA